MKALERRVLCFQDAEELEEMQGLVVTCVYHQCEVEENEQLPIIFSSVRLSNVILSTTEV